MKYGTIVRKQMQAGVITITNERIVNSATVLNETSYCESIFIKNESQILTEFLRLQDEKKDGKIKSYGLMTYANDDGEITRIEKSWTV